MDKKQTPQSKHRTSSNEKLLALPGINEAIETVKQFAQIHSVDEAIEIGGEGEFGEKARQLINNSTLESLDDFLKLEDVGMYIDNIFDEWLEIMAIEAGPKIAELWGLSEAAGRYLSKDIYWGENLLRQDEINFSPILLLSIDVQKFNSMKEHNHEFGRKGVIIASTEQIIKGHIYLDVTELPYQSLRSAYAGINLCRKYMGIIKKDIQAGAPSTIDSEKAMEVVYLKNEGKSSKSIAEKLGFKIYFEDNLSGSYPLLHKYYKLGVELQDKLVKLEKFLSNVRPGTVLRG